MIFWACRWKSERFKTLSPRKYYRKAIRLSKLNVQDLRMLSFLMEYILPDSSSSVCTTSLFPTSGAIFPLRSNQGMQFLLSRLTDATNLGSFVILNSLKLLFQQSSDDYTRFPASKDAAGVSLAPFSIWSDRDMAWHAMAQQQWSGPSSYESITKPFHPFSTAGATKPG